MRSQKALVLRRVLRTRSAVGFAMKKGFSEGVLRRGGGGVQNALLLSVCPIHWVSREGANTPPDGRPDLQVYVCAYVLPEITSLKQWKHGCKPFGETLTNGTPLAVNVDSRQRSKTRKKTKKSKKMMIKKARTKK